MNYNTLYHRLIAKYAIATKQKGDYVERHHILPKCIGGDNSPENLVYLPARVHFICHWMLTKIHKDSDKLKFAFWAMANQRTGDVQRMHYRVSSSCYESAKQSFAIANSKLHKGKIISEEQKSISAYWLKIRMPHKKGFESHLYGIPRTDDVKRKISETKAKHPERNSNFKGYYVTPKGIFATVPMAVKATGFSPDVIRRYCKNNEILVTPNMVKRCNALSEDDVGKPLRELGWDFLPK